MSAGSTVTASSALWSILCVAPSADARISGCPRELKNQNNRPLRPIKLEQRINFPVGKVLDQPQRQLEFCCSVKKPLGNASRLHQGMPISAQPEQYLVANEATYQDDARSRKRRRSGGNEQTNRFLELAQLGRRQPFRGPKLSLLRLERGKH